MCISGLKKQTAIKMSKKQAEKCKLKEIRLKLDVNRAYVK